MKDEGKSLEFVGKRSDQVTRAIDPLSLKNKNV